MTVYSHIGAHRRYSCRDTKSYTNAGEFSAVRHLCCDTLEHHFTRPADQVRIFRFLSNGLLTVFSTIFDHGGAFHQLHRLLYLDIFR